MNVKEKFTDIYENDGWPGGVSKSGKGSDDVQTAVLQQRLPEVVNELKIKTFLDLPCGDFFWMRNVKLPRGCKYIGADIVEGMIANNKNTFPKKDFRVLNGLEQPIPKVDMIFCRDMLVHFPDKVALQFIKAAIDSGSKYIALTTFTNKQNRTDISMGSWRPMNLERAPFELPRPLMRINEKCTEANGIFADKHLAVWELKNLKKVVESKLKSLRIVFYRKTRLAHNPDLWCKYFNKYTDHKCWVTATLPEEGSFDFVHFSNTYVPFEDFLNKSVMHYHGHEDYEPTGGTINLDFPGKVVANMNHIGQGSYKGKQAIRWFPVDLMDPLYDVPNPDDNIKICYTPSKVKGATEYHDKGYGEVYEIFDTLRRNYPWVHLTIITGKSYEECLKEKAKHNIIIDECVTGSYHQSGLEGLAMGKMVIGHICDGNQALAKKMLGSEIPYENHTHESMEEFLMDLLDNYKLKQVLETGKRNREWMDKYWNLQEMLDEMVGIYRGVLDG
jgi:SAM-dependent methyltransferase